MINVRSIRSNKKKTKMTTPRWTKNTFVKLILAILVIACICTFVLLSNSFKLFGTSSSSSSALSTNSEVVETRRSSSLKSLVESWLESKSAYFYHTSNCWCHLTYFWTFARRDLHFLNFLIFKSFLFIFKSCLICKGF